MLLIKPSFLILNHLDYPAMLRTVCQAIEQCYKAKIPSGYKEREQFIAARLKQGHESVIEHVGFSVELQVDRGITHELVRHRLCSFTQESTRYCNYTKGKFGSQITFLMPPEVSAQIPVGEYSLVKYDPTQNDGADIAIHGKDGCIFPIDEKAAVWASAMLYAEAHYLDAVNRYGIVPEIARGILPNATAASIVMTANMREWRHIFKLRAWGETGRPHPQMVEIMMPLFEEVYRRFPVFFSNL